MGFFFVLLIAAMNLYARTDYYRLNPDCPEVEKASQLAFRLLGPDKGAISVHCRTCSLIGRIVDIIGIPAEILTFERALKILDAKVSDTEINIALPGDILFNFDQHDIQAGAKKILTRLATIIRSYPGKMILITGHTDNLGSTEYNILLSQKRAAAVKYWLTENEKLLPTAFHIEGYGETKPRASNESEAGRQQNRRVEITIKKQSPKSGIDTPTYYPNY